MKISNFFDLYNFGVIAIFLNQTFYTNELLGYESV